MKSSSRTAVLLGLWISLMPHAKAAESPASERFCAREPSEIRLSLREAENRLAFKNPAGQLRTGLCWWHSRFTRAAAYLAVFKPDAPALSRQETARRIRALARLGRVVEFPGYANLSELSREFRSEITRALEDWQLRDIFYRNAITRGADGIATPKPDLLALELERVHRKVESDDQIILQKLKLGRNPISTHAWLVISVNKFDGGAILEILDSNSLSGPHQILVFEEDGLIEFRSVGTGAEPDPYLQWALRSYGRVFAYEQDSVDLVRIGSAVRSYCSTGG